MLIQIRRKGLPQEIASYDIGDPKAKVPPTRGEAANQAWDKAIAAGIVNATDRDNYEISLAVVLGYGPDSDLWPWTLLNSARSSLNVADSAMKELGTIVADEPQYLTILYLIGHSMELALKAFLRSRGYNETQLQKIKHNLPRALRAAVEFGFPKRAAEDERLLELLDSTYGAYRRLQYDRATAINVPLLRTVRELSHEIVVESFKALAGNPALLSQTSRDAFGLFIDTQAPYPGTSLVDFRSGSAGMNLRDPK
jgi:hypothetical protein